MLLKRLDLPAKWLGPQQRGQDRVNIKKGAFRGYFTAPSLFVAAKHKSGHSRVNRCGLMGLASHDASQTNFKKGSFGRVFGDCSRWKQVHPE